MYGGRLEGSQPPVYGGSGGGLQEAGGCGIQPRATPLQRPHRTHGVAEQQAVTADDTDGHAVKSDDQIRIE